MGQPRPPKRGGDSFVHGGAVPRQKCGKKARRVRRKYPSHLLPHGPGGHQGPESQGDCLRLRYLRRPPTIGQEGDSLGVVVAALLSAQSVGPAKPGPAPDLVPGGQIGQVLPGVEDGAKAPARFRPEAHREGDAVVRLSWPVQNLGGKAPLPPIQGLCGRKEERLISPGPKKPGSQAQRGQHGSQPPILGQEKRQEGSRHTDQGKPRQGPVRYQIDRGKDGGRERNGNAR